jgi:hypothetical protein
MKQIISRVVRQSLVMVAATLLLAGCVEQEPSAPELEAAQLATLPATVTDGAIAALQRVTARYHQLDVALAEGFVLLHPCEDRPGEGPVGAVYVHIGRLLDGAVNPELPDALVYEPSKKGSAKLVAAEFAVPYALSPNPPSFLGAQFQPEDEFGVWALHVWIWRSNPEGLFAEANPRVSCNAD